MLLYYWQPSSNSSPEQTWESWYAPDFSSSAATSNVWINIMASGQNFWDCFVTFKINLAWIISIQFNKTCQLDGFANIKLATRKSGQRALTDRTIEHKKDPIAISRPDTIGQRIRYSHINNIAGVITTCRKSEHGNIIDHSLKRDKVFKEGQ